MSLPNGYKFSTPTRPLPERSCFTPPDTPMANKNRSMMMDFKEAIAFRRALHQIALAVPTLQSPPATPPNTQTEKECPSVERLSGRKRSSSDIEAEDRSYIRRLMDFNDVISYTVFTSDGEETETD